MGVGEDSRRNLSHQRQGEGGGGGAGEGAGLPSVLLLLHHLLQHEQLAREESQSAGYRELERRCLLTATTEGRSEKITAWRGVCYIASLEEKLNGALLWRSSPL